MKKELITPFIILTLLLGRTPVSKAFSSIEVSTIKVTGQVIASKTKQPIEYANIAIYREADSSFVSGTITNSAGKYVFQELSKDQYYMVVQFVGYKKKNIKGINLQSGSQTKLPDIQLEESIIQLEEVNIRSELTPIEYKPDKRIINAAKSIGSVGGTAVDILENSAVVRTNMNGDVILRNSTNFLVLVDGRQSPFQSTEALKQVPANIIDKIEVITNPSAKYDAEGVSGIINILTKRKKLIGISGIANASFRSNESYSSDLLFNVKKEKTNFYIGVDISKNINIPHFEIIRNFDLNNITNYHNEIIDQTVKRPASNLRMGFEYELSAKTSISLVNILGYSDFRKRKEVNNKQWTNSEDVFYFANNERIDADVNFVNPSLLLIHKFEEKGNQLEIDFTYTYIKGLSEQVSNDFISDQYYIQISENTERLMSSNDFDRTSYQLKSDYLLQIGDNSKFESGLFFSQNKRDAAIDFNNFDYTINDWILNQEFSNELLFNQKIYAAYLMFSGNINKTKFQLGLRSEITNRVLEQYTSNEEFSYSKLHLFPTIHLSRKMSEKLQLQLSYSRRIQRPTDFWLNPYPSSLSAKLMSIGNTELIPDITDSYEFNISSSIKQFTFSINNYYRYTKNAITQVAYLGETGGHIMSFENLNYNSYLGSEISTNALSLWKLKIRPSFDLYYAKSVGKIENFDADYSALSFGIQLSSSINITKSTGFQLISIYNGKSILQQGEMDPYYFLTASLRQEFLQKKLIVVLQARNLFKSGKMKMGENGTNFYNHFQYYPETNLITLNLSYRINNFRRHSRVQRSGAQENY